MIGYNKNKSRFFWCMCSVSLVFGILFILLRRVSTNEQEG